MRAVNLLPSDLRGAAPTAAPKRTRPEPAQGIGAYVVLGALALCVGMLAVYVLAGNTVKQKQADLDEVTTQADAASRQVAALKPYADFDALAKARVATVRGLAAARFDWEQALRDLSRAVPSDVKLSSLDGDMGLPGAAASGGDPLRASIQAPAISLKGCAPSQPSVARLLARLRAVDGVTRVTLSSAASADASTGSESTSPCAGKNPPDFSVVAFFERSAALANIAPATAAASGPSVPVPNAVSGAAKPGATAGSGSAAGSAASNSANAQSAGTSSSTTTSTTTGATTP